VHHRADRTLDPEAVLHRVPEITMFGLHNGSDVDIRVGHGGRPSGGRASQSVCFLLIVALSSGCFPALWPSSKSSC
jgi:hypothetical protein